MVHKSLHGDLPERVDMCVDIALRVRQDRFRLFARRIDLQLASLEDKWSSVAAPCSQRGPSAIRARM